MGRKRSTGEEDRVLRFAVAAVILLFVVGIVVVALKLMNPRVDSSEGRKKLTELSKADVDEIDAKIQELEQAEADADAEWQEKSATEKLEGCLIIGDSLARGLYEYELLDKSLVKTKEGAGVYDPEGTGLSELITEASEAAPAKIFLVLGVKDEEGGQADVDAFVSDYGGVIRAVREALPDTSLYVNSVWPLDFADPVAGHNEKLKELCREESIVFIDNTSLVKEEFYGENGIQMSQDYYTEWLNHMLEAGFRRNGIQ